MDVFELPFGLMTFLGFVLVMPPWMWLLSQYPPTSQLSLSGQFLANLILPCIAALTIASWAEGGARG